MVSSVVVLPAPLAPRRQTTSPSPTVRSRSRTTGHVAVAGDEALGLDQDAAGAGRRSRRGRCRRSWGQPSRSRSRGRGARNRGRRRPPPGRWRTSSGRPAGDLAAELDHVDAVAHAEHEVHVVVDEQAADAGGGDLPEVLAEGDALGRVEAGGRLVEEQRPRGRRASERATPSGFCRPSGSSDGLRSATSLEADISAIASRTAGGGRRVRAAPCRAAASTRRCRCRRPTRTLLSRREVVEQLDRLPRAHQARAGPAGGPACPSAARRRGRPRPCTA